MRSLGRLVLCALLAVSGALFLRVAGSEYATDNASSSKPIQWTFNGRTYRLPLPGHAADTETRSHAPVVAAPKIAAPQPAPASAEQQQASRQPGASMMIAIVAAVIVLALAISLTSRRGGHPATSANEPATNAKGMVIEMNHDRSGTGVITITRRHRKATEVIVEEKVRQRQAALAAQATAPTEGSVDDGDDPFANVPESPRVISERIVAKHTQTVTRRRASGE